MYLIYEVKDITDDVEIRRADLTENAGGELDSLELVLDDSKGFWSQWGPEKNHTVQVKDSGFDSGIMYIDEIGQQRGAIVLRALPIKQEAKQERVKAWENIRLLELVQEIASRWGLTAETYGITNHYYSRVDQSDPDIKFLAWRALLEGYALKVSGGKLILFSNAYMEGLDTAREITVEDIDGDFLYQDKASGIFGACKIINGGIKGEFTASGAYGPTLKYFDLAIGSIGEGKRFAAGLLRDKNCLEKTLSCQLKFDPGIAAGNTVQLSGFGLADGKYFAYQVIHKFVDGKTGLKLRKPLEGY